MRTTPDGGLRVLAVDDEAPALAELVYLLAEDPRVGDVRGAGDGAEALRALDDGDVDAVFLDIRMPGLDGLALARVLARFAVPPALVFVTAHESAAVSAFELQAVDYVLKPVRAARLAEAVRRVCDRLATDAATPPSAETRAVPPSSDTRTVPAAPEPRPVSGAPEGDDEVIPVELAGRTRFVARRDVTHVEAQGGYARLYTRDGASHLVRTPLATLEERWGPAGFVRVHRSRLVALAHVEELRSEQGAHSVRVAGRTVEVARRHARELRERLLARAGSVRP